MEMVHLHAIFASHSSRLQPSLRLPAAQPRRPREAMPLSLAEEVARCVPPSARMFHHACTEPIMVRTARDVARRPIQGTPHM
eukprot:7252888-Prymnesium_polylepis.1